MEIRKFIVTVHEDGTISVVEYIPPEDQSLANYQAGCKDTRTRIEKMGTRNSNLRKIFFPNASNFVHFANRHKK